MNILVPSIPGRLRITQTMIEDTICDPVMTAKVIMGYELDIFQKARLRYYWWVPDVIDESGFSTGKTLVDFIYVNLRCIIIGNFTGLPHEAGVYYPTFETGKNALWPYFGRCRAPIFRAHLGSTEDDMASNKREKKKSEASSCYKAFYKNGSVLRMPAPSFMKNASSAASLRLNTLLVEEWTHIDSGSDGINQQLIGRVTQDSFNRDHPIWGNHRTFTAPAKPISHPSYRRVQLHRQEMRKGNPSFHYIRWCYKDWSSRRCRSGKPFKVEYRDEKTIRRMKVNLETADFEGEALGVRRKSGKGWYSDEVVYPCIRLGQELDINPVISRASDKWDSEFTFYFGGGDTAPAQGRKSDDGAIVTLRARPKALRLAPPPQRRGRPEAMTLSRMPGDWDLALVYGERVRKASARKWAGKLHALHQAFRFTKIMIDHGGGGQWVQPDLRLHKQEIDGIETMCRPITTLEDTLVHDSEAERILIMASRGDYLLREAWPGLQGDDNLVHKLHVELKMLLERQELALCPPIEDRENPAWKQWGEREKWALKILSQLRNQLAQIVTLTDKEGKLQYTKNNALQFDSTGKKDFVSAASFAVAAFLIWLATLDEDEIGGGAEQQFSSTSW